MMVPTPLVLLLSLTVAVFGYRYRGRDSYEHVNLPDCRGSPSSRVRHYMTCPEKAVCADEWNVVRDWYNGTACRERRVVGNCRCPGNMACPVGNDQYMVYSNRKHRRYLCQPKCSVGRCSTRLRASMEMVQNSPEFNGHNYYRINCRCPGHDNPINTRRGQLRRSTEYKRLRFNLTTSTVIVQYGCSRRIPMNLPDPCTQQ